MNIDLGRLSLPASDPGAYLRTLVRDMIALFPDEAPRDAFLNVDGTCERIYLGDLIELRDWIECWWA